MTMTEIFVKAGQLILSLSILVILHELGHFIPAKFFKTRVEKFYLFFDPWFSLFKVRKGETEYGVGWLPLGGYVKIAGMIDESMDKAQLKQPPQPWEFRSKPAWQRLIIMIGGVTVNLLLGFLIYSMTLYVWGEKYLPMKNITDGIWVVDSLGNQLGFENGDKILAINNRPVENFDGLMGELINARTVSIERKGVPQEITLPENFIEKIIDNKGGLIFFPRVPALVGKVPDTSAARKAGLKNGDKIVRINGNPVKYFDEVIVQLKSLKNTTAAITVERNQQLVLLNTPVDREGHIGFVPAIPTSVKDLEEMGLYQFESKHYSLLAAIPAGFVKARERLSWYVKQFGKILQPKTGAYKGVGGFISIGKIFPSTWNWQFFWEMTAFLSLILAFMNILPIPALDGGHVMFLVGEMLTGRKPSEKLLEYTQIAGMVILLGLMLYANGLDLLRLFK